jgi:hypothetical protein
VGSSVLVFGGGAILAFYGQRKASEKAASVGANPIPVVASIISCRSIDWKFSF